MFLSFLQRRTVYDNMTNYNFFGCSSYFLVSVLLSAHIKRFSDSCVPFYLLPSYLNGNSVPISQSRESKSRIRETKNLLTDAERRTNTILEWLHDWKKEKGKQIEWFRDKNKKIKLKSRRWDKKSHNLSGQKITQPLRTKKK